MESRGKQKNLSFFAFTATVKDPDSGNEYNELLSRL